MATVDIDLLINTANSANSIKEVRTQLKAIKDAMVAAGEDSDEFHKLALAAEELKGKLDDVNDRIKAVDPDGFAALTGFASKAAGAVGAVTGAMALFGSESEEVQKAMMKVQAAMQLTQGIESVKGLGKAFKTLWAVIQANPIIALVAAFVALAATAYKVFRAMTETSEATEKANEAYEAQVKLTSEVVRQAEREIALLEAQGGSTEDIIAAKKKLLEAQIAELKSNNALHQSKIQDIEDNDSLWESIISVAAATQDALGNEKAADDARAVLANNKKERAEEELKAVEENNAKIFELETQLLVLDEEVEAKKREDAQKTYETLKDLREKEEAEWLASLTAIAQAEERARQEKLKKEQELQEALNDLRIADRERRDKQLEEEAAEVDKFREMFAIGQQSQAENAAAFAKDLLDRGLINFVEYSAAILQIQKETDAARQASQMELAGATISILSSLAGFAKQGSKAQKTLALTQIAAETAVGFIKGLVVAQTAAAATGPGAAFAFPIFYATQIAAVLAAAKKAKDVLNSGGSGGGGPVAPSMSSGGGGIAAINTPPAQPQPSTQLDQNGNVSGGNGNQQNEPMRVYVVESDITRTQNRVAVIEQSVSHR